MLRIFDWYDTDSIGLGYKYPTEYRVERFYPDYYTAPRPAPTGLPTTLGYGGNYFDVKLSASDLGAISNLDNTKVVIIRTGFSTHAMVSCVLIDRVTELTSQVEYGTKICSTVSFFDSIRVSY